ncbi:MAG: TonB-dependent receptor plug domain-containing protein [Crocinitomicaceae bacterium]|nr:TonB-dependent receptor plug domain-containing protein [Crocinitomicaceae bacterium]
MFRHKNALFAIVFILFGMNQLNAQNGFGYLIGKVTNENALPVVDAKISFSGTTESVQSDVEGKFDKKLAVGKIVVTVDYAGFDSQVDTVIIEEGKTSFVSFVMTKVEGIGQVDIKAKKKQMGNTVGDAIKTKKMSIQVVESIGAEEFSKTTIRTVADVFKRMTGLTISEGKFANVRGMFDRYNAGYLNGAPLPSTESDRKAFSFDIIPAGLLDNVTVIKSGSPDLIGDFGGGIIKINTKSIPEKLTQNFSIGFQYNSITTGNPVRTFAIGNAEYFGMISAGNKIPTLDSRMKVDYENPVVNVAETKKFNNDWKLAPLSAMPSPRISYTLGVPFKVGKMSAGMMVSWNYSMTQKFSYGNVDTRDFSDNRLNRSYQDSTFGTNVQNGGIANFSLKINNKNKIDFKNLISLTYDVSSIIRRGVASYDDQLSTNGYSNFANLNKLYSSQLIGTHSIGKNQSSINWVLNYGLTNRQVPDFRIAQYSYTSDDITTRQLNVNPFFRDGSGRFFSNLDETSYSGSVDYNTNLKTGKVGTMLKLGIYTQRRDRVFDSRQFIYGPLTATVYSLHEPEIDLAENKITEKGLYLIEKTRDKDDYTAFSSLQAAYLMFENNIPMFKKDNKNYDMKITWGVRFEQFKQQLKNRALSSMGRTLADPPMNSDFLPSININTPINRKSSIRMAYYKTLNRPELRELAPFAFYNFSINSEILGSQYLDRATIDNYDMRWEIYSNKEDMFSMGIFAKNIKNPIEFSLDPTQTQIRTFTYQNQSIAINRGIEMEVRKNLGSFIKVFGWSWLKNITFYANLALIESKVTFDGNQSRTLQGQSPYVVNTSLFYENKKGWQVNASFNKIGQRIAYIGLPVSAAKFGLDIYEYGRSILDVQVAKKIGKNGLLRITFGDLLAQKSVFYQDMNRNGKYDEATVLDGGDNTLISFTNGRTINFGYSINF